MSVPREPAGSTVVLIVFCLWQPSYIPSDQHHPGPSYKCLHTDTLYTSLTIKTYQPWDACRLVTSIQPHKYQNNGKCISTCHRYNQPLVILVDFQVPPSLSAPSQASAVYFIIQCGGQFVLGLGRQHWKDYVSLTISGPAAPLVVKAALRGFRELVFSSGSPFSFCYCNSCNCVTLTKPQSCYR